MVKKYFSLVLILLSFRLLCGPLKREPNPFFVKNILNAKQLPSKNVILKEGEVDREKPNNPPPFNFNSYYELLNEYQRLKDGNEIKDSSYDEEILKSLDDLKNAIENYENVTKIEPEQTMELMSKKYKIENLIGLAVKGQRSLKSKRFYRIGENRKLIRLENTPSKVNTGWILDQQVYDPSSEKYFPSIPFDIRSNDEGPSDIEVDDEGWVWEVQSFYFSDSVSGDHPSPSYCLGVYLSPDGGSTWYLYEVLYDPSSKDIINPRLAIDILPSENRFFIAYEYAYSQTDHDIYVYSETFGSTPNGQDAPIATSSLMERNPDIASDFYQGQTSYRVVVFEKEASLGSYNIDIYGSQSTGAGASADWTSAVAIAADVSIERNPALSNGASGYSTITQYIHLAYNYDSVNSNQLLLNNGFESGNNGNWTVTSAGDIDCSGSYQRSGTCCAWLAGINSYTDFIYQDITIQSNALMANFSFYLKITSSEGTTTPYDFLYIQLRDTSNNVIATLQTFSNVDKNTYASYQQLTYNLLPYAGQTLRIYFYATTDFSNITSFFIDDTAVDVISPTGFEVRYAKASHPGATPYPTGLSNATKITVLSNMNDPTEWQYGPPSVIATHGGSSTMTSARVVVSADQHFPANTPNSGDLDRHQITFAFNMCNGSTTCGNLNCNGTPITLNWQEAWFYDSRGDERFPSLIQDGAGLQTKGLDSLPYIYMTYFHRAADEPTGLGEVQLILSVPSDETCDGFIQGYWYYFTNSYTASDPDNLVDPKPRTINAFNYWIGWPGVSFNKYIKHLSGGSNDDIYVTTLGDNYTFYTYSLDQYLDLVISVFDETYSTPHTFPWAAGYKIAITAVSPQDENGYSYAFWKWSNDQTDPVLTVVTDFCDPVNPCPVVDYIATYYASPMITSIVDIDGCSQSGIQIFYNSGYGAISHDLYKDNVLAVSNFLSGSTFNPNDTGSHLYKIMGNYGSVTLFSIDVAFIDEGGVTEEVTSESFSEDKTTYSWQPISSLNYRVLRGSKADLPNLLNSNPDGCLKYFGSSTSVSVSADDPSSVDGRFFFYIIQGVGGNDPNVCTGPAGNATSGPRQVSWDGVTTCY